MTLKIYNTLTKEKEELYDLEKDPFETVNLINDPSYADVANKLRGHYEDWNKNNHDFGFEPINWENSPPPRATAVIDWLKKERPEVIEKMKKGIEPGFGTLVKEFRAYQSKK